MTYNIHSGRGLDGRLQLERIARVIEAEDPDWVALQEVDSQRRRTRHQDQAAWLAQRLGYHCAFVAARKWKRGEYGNAILSRVPPLECRRIILPKPGRLPLEMRCLMQCRYQWAGQEIEVWNTHLGLLAAERRAQVRLLLEHINHSGVPLILCGDFNARIRSPEVLGLAGLLHRIPSQRTFPGVWPLLHLDHIFVSPQLHWRSVYVTRSALARRASDHLPLVAELQFTELSRIVEPF
jgi:endonuclease/exonuclease/phosphatase family metal-dependent hydrolase